MLQETPVQAIFSIAPVCARMPLLPPRAPAFFSNPTQEDIMYYSHDEIVEIAKESGLQVDRFGNYEWTDGKGSYWRVYLLKPQS